jgi:4-hydroxybenzoyl-CoA reductase subunit alpha
VMTTSSNKQSKFNVIGKPVPQIFSREKVTGKAIYTDDIRLLNPLHIKILRSPLASAKLTSIDLSKAKALSGVVEIITGEDFKNTFGVLPISKDEPALAKGEVRYVGEPIVAVAAESEAIANQALDLIKIEYQQTAACLLGKKALKATDTPIHPELERENNLHKKVGQEFGDIEKGFAEATFCVEKKFEFAAVTHAFTEPHATQVEVDEKGNIIVHSATQVPHYLHLALAEVLEIPEYKVRVIKPHLGGGFGGKSDPFPHEMIAAKLALKTGRHTRLVFSREDVFFSHHGRHPTTMKMKLGFDPEVGITALTADILIDGGAYGSFGIVTTYYNGVLLQGPYPVPNFKFDCSRVYTNKPMCGAMRGHGGVNPRFASETLFDIACTETKVDPCQTRIDLIHKENKLTVNEFRITSVGLKNGLTKAMARSGWKDKYGKLPYGKGIGVACGFFISGSALPIHWNKLPSSTVRITIEQDGALTIYSGAADIGQGSDTVLVLMAAEVLGVSMDKITVIAADTKLTPVDLGSYSSRVTFMMGNAAKNAAIRMRRVLAETAYQLLEIEVPPYPDVEPNDDFFRQGGRKPDFENGFLGANPNYDDDFIFSGDIIQLKSDGRQLDFITVVNKALEKEGILQTRGTYKSPKLGGKFKGAGAGLSPSYSFTAFITEVTVDTETGFVKVDKITCAHDCGFQLNPLAVEGQIEGCIHMGLGQALMEEVVHDNGAVQNPSFLEYKMLSAFEQPEIDIVPTPSDENEGPFGAKEAGEGVLAPVIPSVGNAIFDAVGVRLTQLPMRPDRVLAAITKKNKTLNKQEVQA